ncbi:MAG: hypothetical protein E7310_03635 [Clostridiales bacterium]|nr:hypothetical protein [Clostridiales bacterium]
MKIVTPVVIIPEPGEGLLKLASKIYASIETGEIGAEMVFLKLPVDPKYPDESGKMIEVTDTSSIENIRDSIGKQTVRWSF